jgi:hypothetical protein
MTDLRKIIIAITLVWVGVAIYWRTKKADNGLIY